MMYEVVVTVKLRHGTLAYSLVEVDEAVFSTSYASVECRSYTAELLWGRVVD